MSLINKMLQDLEQRHAEPPAAAGLSQAVRAASVPQRDGRKVWMVVASVVLLAVVIVGLVWLHRPHGVPPTTAAHPGPASAAQGGQVARAAPAAPTHAIVMPASTPAVATSRSPASGLALKVDTGLAALPASPANENGMPAGAPSHADVSVATDASQTAAAKNGDMAVASVEDKSVPRHLATRSAPRKAPHPSTTAEVSAAQPAAPAAPSADQAVVVNREAPTPQQQAANDYRQAVALIQQGRASDAEALLERILQVDPRNVDARQALLALLVDAQRYDEAMRLARSGLQLDSQQPGFAMILARLQLDKGDLNGAIATLQRTLPAAANSAEYQAFLAALLQRAGRDKDAADLYVSALQKAPQSGVWWMGLGMALEGDKRPAQARDAYVRARDTGTLAPSLEAYVEQKITQLSK